MATPTDSASVESEPRTPWEWSSTNERFTVAVDPFPLIEIGKPSGFQLHLGVGSLLFFGLVWLCGSLMWDMREELSTIPGLGISSFSGPMESSASLFGLGFVFLVLTSTLIHESGHGFGYLLTGRRWGSLNFGAAGASVTTPSPVTNSYQHLLITFLGGGFQATAGLVSLALLDGPGWSLLQIAAMFSTIVGFANVLLPIGGNCDGNKFWRHLIRVLTGRGGRSLLVDSKPR